MYPLFKLLFLVIFSNVITALSSRDYLTLKSQETKDFVSQFYATHDTDEDVESDGVGKLKNLWSRASKASQPRAVNLFDQIFIVDEQQVFSVALNLDQANNTRDDEHQLNLASPNEPINFIKSYFWNNSSYVIICQMSYCTHYQGLDVSTFKNRQLIEYPGLIPIDASYFTHADQLYLVVAYNHGNYLDDDAPPSKIFQWNGTHMTWVYEMFPPAPKSVVTFQNGPSTVILFTIEPDLLESRNRKSGCVIYEMNDGSFTPRIKPLNNMDAIASIYPYNYGSQQFFLKIDYTGAAEILKWDGTSFVQLAVLPDFQPFDQIRIVQIDDETLLFISDLNALHVYKIDNQKVTHLNDLILMNQQRIIEITVWKYGNSVMMLLVKMNPDATFQTELWELNLYFEKSDDDKYGEVWSCFKELKNALDFRASAIANFKAAQTTNLSYSNNSEKTSAMHLTDLIINGGNISVAEFRGSETEVPRFQHMKEQLLKLKDSINAMKNDMDKDTIVLTGNISVDSNVYFEELHIDNLDIDYINGEMADFNNYLISGIDQQFSKPLSIKNVGVDDLYVSSLCGYGFDNWMQVNDTIRTKISDLGNITNSSIVGDKIVIDSDVTVQELKTKNINGINLNDFLEDIFLIGKRQVIKGELRYEGIVQVAKLHAEKVNNVSSSDLITKPSNQSLQDVFIDRLEVEQLYVEKINGVPVDRAARMSQENVIKAKVTLSNFIITDELTVKENIAIPLTHSTQDYEHIYIDGDVFIKNLELEDRTSLNLSSNLVRSRIYNLVDGSWTKSTGQTIAGPITLEKGASIDELNCPYLNGLSERDFLYTDCEELNDLDNVTFSNFHFNALISESSPSTETFVEETNDLLTFHKSVRMRYLSVDNIFTDKYNGMKIESIMQSNDLLELPDELEFETVRVDGRMTVDDLRINRLNQKSTKNFEKALRIDQDLTLNSLSRNNLTLVNLNISKLNGEDFEEALAAQATLLNQTSSPISLTIDGEVTIDQSIQAERINDEAASDYIGRLRDVDPSRLIDIESLVNLTIAENLHVELLNGQKIDDIFATSLSRTKRQTFNGQVTFIDTHINYLTADKINNVELSKLMYADQASVFSGNVSFSNLYVVGDVTSKTINGENTSKVRRKLHHIPIASLENLLVQGDLKWDKPSTQLNSLTYLFDNAVTKHKDQLIDSPVTFEKPLIVDSLELNKENSEIAQKISEIIYDTVIDKAGFDPITVRGTKTFKQELIVSNLEVDGNIDIKQINGLDIDDVNANIFQKDKIESILSDITFLNNVEIGRLVTMKTNIHGVPSHELAVIGDKMPKKLHFRNLVVDGNVSLYKLDGIEFDDFLKRRVTVDEDNEIFVDVEFINTVQVLNGTFVTSVNKIVPEHLVQNSVDGILPIMIHGNKIFKSELVVEHNIETPIINNIQVDSIFTNAVLKDTDSDILGSLIFEGNVEISGNVTVSGEYNELKLQRFGEIKYLQNRLALNQLNKGISLLNDSINKAANTPKAFRSTVLYLEEDKNLNLHFARVQSIKSPATSNNRTRLEIITTARSTFCGVQSGCSCREQYVVDIFPSGQHDVLKEKPNNVTFSFYPLNGVYGLKIVSGTVSFSEQCSKTIGNYESSQIFWFKLNKNQEVLRRTPAVQLTGYVSDAQIFQINDQIYLIVTIFYNKETKSHATDSFLYQFDSKNRTAILAQSIPTDGAKNIEVFLVPNVGIHALIGCVKGKAESQLLRFNPTTRQFQIIRTFATGGSKYVASLSANEKSFVILNNPDVSALQIFSYDESCDNYVDYQNLFFQSKVTSLSVFYGGDFGNSDAFVVTTTKDGWLYIYEYAFYGMFQLKMSYWADDIQIVKPFRHFNENYLFAGFKFNSTVYKVIQQGYY